MYCARHISYSTVTHVCIWVCFSLVSYENPLDTPVKNQPLLHSMA